MIENSAESCISTLFLFSSPSLETCNPPPPPTLDTTHPQENTRFYDNTLESGRLETINIKPWKPILPIETVYLKYWSVLIDIIVTIRISNAVVGTGCNFPYSKVGNKSHHIKTYSIYRLTIIS